MMVSWPDLLFGPINLWTVPKENRSEMRKVVVYSKTNCPGCVQVKRSLSLKGVLFEEVNIETNTEQRHWLLSRGHRSVPQVYVDGVHTNPYTITNEIVD